MLSHHTICTCLNCGKDRRVKNSDLKLGRGKFCSIPCRAAHQHQIQITSRPERFWAKVNKDGPIQAHCPELGPCWVWTGLISERGYGVFDGTDPEYLVAHRASYLLNVGQIPDGLFVLHRCDNRPCIRPSHLFPGTQLDNMRDMDSKGRRVVPKERPWLRKTVIQACRTCSKETRVNRYQASIGEGRYCSRDCHSAARRGQPGVTRGEKIGGSKLTESTVLAMRADHAAGIPQVVIAAKYGVSKQQTCAIVNRKRWTHI